MRAEPQRLLVDGGAPLHLGQAARTLDGSCRRRSGLNIAHEAVDRHAGRPARGIDVALRWHRQAAASGATSPTASSRGLTNRFAERRSPRWASARATASSSSPAASRAVRRGARRAGSRQRRSARCSPPSGPSRSGQRLTIGEVQSLVTTDALYRRKVRPGAHSRVCPARRYATCSLVRRRHGRELPGRRDARLSATAGAGERLVRDRPTGPETPRCCTSRAARPARRRARSTSTRRWSRTTPPARCALDLHPDDIFWCTADPGWVTGTSYGIIAPLTNGVTIIVDEARLRRRALVPHPARRSKVTVWYTAPTAIRMLMKAGAELARAVRSFRAALRGERRRAAQPGGGGVGPGGARPAVPRQLVADRDRRHHDRQLRGDGQSPGLDGPAAAGIEAAIVRRARGRRRDVLEEPDVQGELALRPGWPSMFRGYLGRSERYRKCFAGGWYLTGDLARRDADGYFWFVGRKDDVIKTIGPPDRPVRGRERAAGAPGGGRGRGDRQARPDRGEVVKAFVALKPGVDRQRGAAARAARLRAA